MTLRSKTYQQHEALKQTQRLLLAIRSHAGDANNELFSEHVEDQIDSLLNVLSSNIELMNKVNNKLLDEKDRIQRDINRLLNRL